MNFEVYDIAIIPIIVGLVGLFNKAGVSARFLPLCALILGAVSGLVYVSPDDPKKGVFVGVVMGLSAIGAYSGVKNSVQDRIDELSESEKEQIANKSNVEE